MRSLDSARSLCDRYHPGLLKALEEIPFAEREAPGSPAIDLFRTHGGVGLLVPTEFGGHGADPVDAVQVQRAIGAVSPSVAAAVTMHHFTVSMLYSLAERSGRLAEGQLELLHRVVPEQILMASGWAEGKTQQNIFAPSVVAVPAPGGYRLNGIKKPCSLAHSMQLLTASIAVPGPDGTPELALALVPASSEGLTVHPFWGNDVLAASESDEVRLTDVFVPDNMVVRTTEDDPDRLDELQTAGVIWFEMLISAGYAGAAAALAELVVQRERGSVSERSDVVINVESAFHLLEGAARAVRDGLDSEEAVAQVLIARYATQDLLAKVSDKSLELLGGIDFIRSSDHARLAASVRPLVFHPPGRSATAGQLVDYVAGKPLDLS
ncbi:acyl-CoA/acyl-ACP dehydrogenase (plasmid) [Streptomyces sp. NBC_01387]|uniref:acyl-CoA dehydrogenase family protein n=1 Tax=unclassified Streptomyces TaxID=2593676 RepID=UPI002023EBBD|nr:MULTISPECIES: acyl-CoA dehydrogenase family protein [unclassified Streptomyces]MCX4554412.1 acyl-CoA/acyl-ACP dehydrogenase [Streptomyces sp. NBC_01500]WSC25208.1 acyl-CoA/acyl-ACP dehydrogenase [Streptomyces sp. NBC_01766]WSV58916.1 acyl-CoA/acyl-ACP dehydrogenase [Streptomyces sp. NBC_01014]